MEIYNLGIGLTVVDHATKAVQSVDAALVSLAESTEGATKAADGLDHALVGGSVVPSLEEAAESSEDLTIRVTDTDIAFTKFEASARLLSQSLGLVGTDLKKLPKWMSQIRDEQGRFTTMTWENMNGLERVALGATKTVSSFRELLKAASAGSPVFSALGRELKESGEAISGVAESIERLEFMGREGDVFVELEDASRKMSAGFGQGREEAYQLRSEMLQLVGTTQFSIGEVTRMTQGLAAAGVSLTELSEGQQQAFIALNDLYGVSGQEIAKADANMRSFGGSMVGALDDATKFQTAFRMPGMMEQLPGVIDEAMSATVQFGKAVVGSGAGIVKSVSQTAGVYAKAFGKTMAEAVQAAQRTFERFAKATRTHRRVFLGLEDDFDPLAQSMMMIGINLDEGARIMADAQKEPLAFVERMRYELDRLPDQYVHDRFMEQLRDELPEELMRAIEYEKDYLKLVDAHAEAERRRALGAAAGTQSFKELTDGMLDTTKELQKMWFNVKQLGIAFLTQTGLTEVLKETFGGAKDALASFNMQVQALIESDEIRAWGEVITPVLGAVGKGVLLLSTVFGGLLSVAGGAAATFGKLRILGKVFGPLGKVLGRFPRIAGALSKVGPLFFRMLGPIGLVVSGIYAVMDGMDRMSETLSDPDATGVEKFRGGLEAAVVTVASFFDNVLLGIPGWLADKFFPEFRDAFDTGFANWFAQAHLLWSEVEEVFVVGATEIAVGVLNTIDRIIIGWELLKEAGVNAWSWLQEKARVAGVMIASEISTSFSGMKATILEVLAGITGALTPMISDALATVKQLVEPFASVSDTAASIVSGITKAENAVAGVGNALAATAATARKSHEEQSAGYEDLIKTIKKTGAAERAERTEAVDRRIQQLQTDMDERERASQLAEARYQAEQSQLEQTLHVTKQRKEEAKRFLGEHKSAVESAIVELQRQAKESGGFDESQLRGAESALRKHMETSLRTLTRGVSKGEISFEEAQTKLEEARQRGMEEAMRAREARSAAGDVADKAGGAGAGAIPAEVWRSVVNQLEGRGGGDQKVKLNISFRGVGGAFEQEVARRASAEEAGAGTG